MSAPIRSKASELKIHIQAGSRLYAGGKGVVQAIAIPKPGEKPRVVWNAKIEGTPHRMLAADDRLFVVTIEGNIYAFGKQPTPSPVVYSVPKPKTPAKDQWTRHAADILKAGGVKQGYALMLGVENGRLVEELVGQSELSVIAIDADTKKVAKLREQLVAAGL